MEQLTIGQVAKHGGVNLETIRYYERRGLLPQPPRTDSGYRAYQSGAVDRIHFIKRAQELGFSLREIQELVFLLGSPHTTKADVKRRAEAKLVDVQEKLRALQRIKRHLERLVGACSGRGPLTECPIIEYLSAPSQGHTSDKAHRASKNTGSDERM